MSETRQRNVLVPVRMTLAEAALLDAAVRRTGARGRGTLLREAFMDRWHVAVEPLREPGAAAGQPDTIPPPPSAPGPAQARTDASQRGTRKL